MLSSYSKNFVPVLFALSLGIFPQLFAPAQAETVLVYDFEDSNGDFDLNADLVASALDPAAWQVAASSIRDFSGNPGRAMASSGFSTGNTFLLNVAVEPGTVVQLSGFAFDQLASASGPASWQLEINGFEVASGATTGSFSTESALFDFAPLTDAFVIGLSGAGASSNLGTFRVDNFTLSANIQPVPLPASSGLLAAACLGLGSYKRKTHLPLNTPS